jgi:hypothetical protein
LSCAAVGGIGTRRRAVASRETVAESVSTSRRPDVWSERSPL